VYTGNQKKVELITYFRAETFEFSFKYIFAKEQK